MNICTMCLSRLASVENRCRWSWPLLLIALTIFSSPYLSAQSAAIAREGDDAYSPDELNFYLLQALKAASTVQRIKLNHIGIQLALVDGEQHIASVLDGYPAHQAGLQRADKIIEIDGQPFHPVWSFNSASENQNTEFIAIPKQYTVHYQRGDTSHITTVVPVFENLYDSYRSATSNSLMHFASGNKTIGYIHFWTLSRATNDLISYNALFQQLANTDGLILDLRGSYGYLSAQHLDAIFPSRRSYYQLTDSSGTLSKTFQSAQVNGDYYGKPIVVLQDDNTIGDMELFANQIGKLQRGVTIGTNTAGKIGRYTAIGPQSFQYQQSVNPLVDGERFEGSGRKPDYQIEFSLTEPQVSDPQYETAVGVLLGIM